MALARFEGSRVPDVACHVAHNHFVELPAPGAWEENGTRLPRETAEGRQYSRIPDHQKTVNTRLNMISSSIAVLDFGYSAMR